jgi:hypothetical protein
MSTSRSKMRHLHGAATSLPHARRTEYPQLAPGVKPAEPTGPHPLRWSSWADDRTIETEVDPEEWPDWTDRYFIAVDPIEGDER